MAVRFVAEISGNHAGNLENALQLIREAKNLQAEVKFQCFHPMALAQKRAAEHLGTAYSYETLHKIYLKTYTRASWWPDIKRELGDWPWSCSVFSTADLEFMEYQECPSYKIASFEFTDLALIEAVARKRKPMVLSVNDSNNKQTDILNAWDIITKYTDDITFLYATPYDAFHVLDAYTGLVDLSDMAPAAAHTGLSDHSPSGNSELVDLCAESWLINMVERHLCLPGVETPDNAFSDTPQQFKAMMEAVSFGAPTPSK